LVGQRNETISVLGDTKSLYSVSAAKVVDQLTRGIKKGITAAEESKNSSTLKKGVSKP
jgi:hypothetical protein